MNTFKMLVLVSTLWISSGRTAQANDFGTPNSNEQILAALGEKAGLQECALIMQGILPARKTGADSKDTEGSTTEIADWLRRFYSHVSEIKNADSQQAQGRILRGQIRSHVADILLARLSAEEDFLTKLGPLAEASAEEKKNPTQVHSVSATELARNLVAEIEARESRVENLKVKLGRLYEDYLRSLPLAMRLTAGGEILPRIALPTESHLRSFAEDLVSQKFRELVHSEVELNDQEAKGVAIQHVIKELQSSYLRVGAWVAQRQHLFTRAKLFAVLHSNQQTTDPRSEFAKRVPFILGHGLATGVFVFEFLDLVLKQLELMAATPGSLSPVLRTDQSLLRSIVNAVGDVQVNIPLNDENPEE